VESNSYKYSVNYKLNKRNKEDRANNLGEEALYMPNRNQLGTVEFIEIVGQFAQWNNRKG
jgi:hypothetical protein